MKPCWAVITSPGVSNRGILLSSYIVDVIRADANRRSIFVVILIDHLRLFSADSSSQAKNMQLVQIRLC